MAVIQSEEPVMGDNEVLLRLEYVGFCGSDLNTFLGRNPMVHMPVIPGHEVGAVIEKVGDNVPDGSTPANTTRRSACSATEPCESASHCPGRKSYRPTTSPHALAPSSNQ